MLAFIQLDGVSAFPETTIGKFLDTFTSYTPFISNFSNLRFSPRFIVPVPDKLAFVISKLLRSRSESMEKISSSQLLLVPN